MAEKEDSPPFSPLVASVFQRRAEDTAAAVNLVLDNQDREIKRLKATLQLIRDGVQQALEEPMTLMIGQRLQDALEPDEEEINYYVNHFLEE